jgi:flagellin-like hook-associated protein FlgL
MSMISTRTNMNAVAAARNLGYAQSQVDKSMINLSTGLRINKAADDAAGLAISEKLKSQINGLNQASRNAKDAISLVQTAEGALGEIGNMLQRVRTLALQSVNDVNTVSERSSMQKEVAQLQTEITRLALASEFNGQKLLDGSFQSKRFQVGANSGQEIALSIGSVSSAGLGVNRISSSDGSHRCHGQRRRGADPDHHRLERYRQCGRERRPERQGHRRSRQLDERQDSGDGKGRDCVEVHHCHQHVACERQLPARR